ncbi:MAG: sigma-54-dependent Fis family transcriptional regulator, partial [Planctomycetota bacterium]
FRLCVVKLDLPPLRERGGDIILLAEHFLRQFSQRAGRPAPVLTEAAKKKLREHSWPGNVRELRNLMERLAYLSPKETVEADDIAFILTPGGAPTGNVPPNLTLQEATDLFQRAYILQVLRQTGGNIGEAADRLGLHRSNLYRKMRKFDIDQ